MRIRSGRPRDEMQANAMERMRRFTEPRAGRDWLSLGTTKTGMARRLLDRPLQAYELKQAATAVLV